MGAITGKEGVASFSTADYVAPPLVPANTYNGFVKNVKLTDARLMWAIELDANDGSFCDDGETPVDGNVIFVNCWLPLEGDDQEFQSKAGKPYEGGVSRHQFKVNQLARFALAMRIDQITSDGLDQAIANGDYLDKEVTVVVKHEEYNGSTSVQGDRLKARS